MRFHHSTRRGRNRLQQHQQQQPARLGLAGPRGGCTKCASLGYCRETNIHFNRRLPVQYPATRKPSLEAVAEREAQLEPEVAELDNELARQALERLELDGQAAAPKAPKAEAEAEPCNRPSTSEADELELAGARERLVAQVAKHPFWSGKAARRMRLTGHQRRGLFIYELVSYCERRDLEWRYEPYRGGLSHFRRTTDRLSSCPASPASPASPSNHSSPPSPTESPMIGARIAPQPEPELVWALEVPIEAQPATTRGAIYTCELPESSFVKRCHGCAGRGRLKCSSCHGVGYEVCISCSGRGTSRSREGLLAAGSRSTGSGEAYSSSRASEGHGGAGSSSDWGASERRRTARNSPSATGSGAGAGSGGWLATEACHFCHGAGQKRCWVCAGRAYNQCSGCLGAGQLRCYLSLNVSWSNHRDERILNNADSIIPRERVRLASGLLLAEQISRPGQPLDPLELFPVGSGTHVTRPAGSEAQEKDSKSQQASNLLDELTRQQIHAVSRRLLQHHAQTYRSEKLLRQRHKVTQIECHIVTYEWRKRSGHFVIYGDEKKVYIAKYPFKSICNIT